MMPPLDQENQYNPALERKSLREEIFSKLHQRIISGKTAPGEWLRQEDIANQLKVSQTPVREALDLLVASGLAERIPYRGVRVLQLSTEEIADSFALRLLLEGSAASAAALQRTPEQLAHLTTLVNRTGALMSLSDMPAQMQLNREFHLALVQASGNSLLTKLYEVVSHQFPDWMLYEYMFRHPELLADSLSQEFQEHESIVKAIANCDPKLAALHVRTHINNLGQELVDFLGVPAALLKQKETALTSFLEFNTLAKKQ